MPDPTSGATVFAILIKESKQKCEINTARVSSPVRRRIAGVYTGLIAFNVGVWICTGVAFRTHPALMGSALLAYSFGLRHGLDADHLAAIDNVTRAMMQAGRRPISVGLWFSLGHSTVVVVGSVAIAMSAVALQGRWTSLRSTGAFVGTAVSAFFLFGIALLNVFVLRSVWRTFQQVRHGRLYYETELSHVLAGGGVMARLLRRVFHQVTDSWHMYPLGILFGLGFDTATEIGVLGIAATEATHGQSLATLLLFPALFAAGMTLVDTTDAVLMLHAYGWALVQPVRKLYYNLIMTMTSVLIAVVVGSLEVLGMVEQRWQKVGAFWRLIARLNRNFSTVGLFIVAFTGLSWLAAMLLYRCRNFDSVDAARDVQG